MSESRKLGVRARQKAERPGKILEAAFQEFVSKGFVAARVEDIAARVGVTKGAVYFYFETKERLFEETIASVTAAIALDVKHSRPPAQGSYTEQLKEFVRSIYGHAEDHPLAPNLFRLLVAEAPRFPDLIEKIQDQYVSPSVAVIERMLIDGVAAGEFAQSDLLKFPQMVASPMMLLAFWNLRFGDRRPVDMDAFIEAHLEMMVNGLRGAR